MIEIQVIDLFSGCGGMSCGFTSAATKNISYKLLGGLDIDKHANATYTRMLQKPALNISVTELRNPDGLRRALDAWKYDPKKPLVLIGCAPCQGFSSHRKKDSRKDDRNDLIGVFGEIVAILKPEVVVMENVPEILHATHWSHFVSFKKMLEKNGYTVRARLHNAAEFGVPQERFRALVIASRDVTKIHMPTKTNDASNFRSVRDAIGGLQPLTAGQADPNDPMHLTSKHRPETVALLRAIPSNGGSRSALPPEMVKDCHKSVDGFRDVYGRLWWDRPAVSITARCRTPSCGRFTHPEQHRGLSVREAALLQSFPADWYFEGPFDDKYKQIGNAVPPLFAKAVAETIDQYWVSEVVPTSEALQADIESPIGRSISSSLAAWKKRARDTAELNGAQKKIKFRAVDLFCGAGGLSLGFLNGGFDIVFAADNDSESLATYRRNLGDHVHKVDLSEGSPRSIASMIQKTAGNIDILIGGPPCQGFSIQRRGTGDDSRNNFLLRHVQIGIALNAKAILIENVPTILGGRGKTHMTELLDALNVADYCVNTKVLQAADYGVAQLRRRAFVVAIHKDYTNGFEIEIPALDAENYVTVRQALAGLPALPDNYVPHPEVPNYQRRKISAINLERLSHVPEGGGRLDIPENLRLPCHCKDNGHRHLDVYGRMSWNKPAPTITAMFDNFTRGRFGHPNENRNITNREGARLQSFADSFVFLGNQKSVARQIGNAVPPKLAEAVALFLLSYLSKGVTGQKNTVKCSSTGVECVQRQVAGEQLPSIV